MKTFIKKLKQFLTLIFSAWFIFSGRTQSIEQTIAFAENQMLSGNYISAISLYQRVLFFEKEKGRSQTYHAVGDCYFQSKEFESASKHYSLAYFSEKNDSVKSELIFKSTQCYLLLNDYNAALTELFNLPEKQTKYFERKRNFFSAIAYWEMGYFERSEEFFLKSIEEINIPARNEIHHHFIELRKIKINSKTAGILSIIFPGAGQLYAGDYKNAINSFLVTTAMLALYLHVIRVYSFVDAFIAVFPWFQRYYTGGIKKAGIIAGNKLKEKRNRVFLQIINTVEVSVNQ